MHRPIRPNEMRKVAESLGFELKAVRGSHWQFKKNGVGKATIPRYKEISDDIFGWVCRQLKINKKQFWNILNKL